MVPVDKLVVPENGAPRLGDDQKEITASIRRAFGSMLESVSVESTSFDEETESFRVSYRLTDCPTLASTYVSDLTETGVVPPLTQFSGTRPGVDWMAPLRFRELLAAWGKVSKAPFGALESYSTAYRGSGGGPIPARKTSATIGGKTRAIADMWVITPGAASKAEFQRLQGGDSNKNPQGYVFFFPTDGAPEYLGLVPELGEYSML